MRLQSILCAVDFSDFSAAVLRCGADLARRFDARLLVFHAVYRAADQVHPSTLFERGGEQKQRLSQAQETIRVLMSGCPVRWEPVVEVGEPVETVGKTATKRGVDLVVAASHGLTGLKRILLGRVVERMARSTMTPLWILRGSGSRPHAGEAWAPPPLDRILVGCPLGSGSLATVHWGRLLAGEFEAMLTLLHAMETPAPRHVNEGLEGHYTQAEERWRQKLEERLLGMIPHDLWPPSRFQTALVPGLPGEALLERAVRLAADLVVVGVRHRTRLNRILVGSTTETILQRAPCSILVVPESAPHPFPPGE